MTTNNPYTAIPAQPIPVVHQCAADLWRALLAAAETAPDFALPAIKLSPVRILDDGEDLDDNLLHSHGLAWVHGPTRPDDMVDFFFSTAPSSKSIIRLPNARPRLLTMANTVRKHWALYGGGPLPADLAKPRAPRKAVSWPSTILRAWRIQMQEPDHLGAMITGDTLGVVYFPGPGSVRAIALAAPVQVDGLPNRMCSALCHDGRYVVACMLTGRAIIVAGAGSRARAEADALAEWERMGADKAAAQIAERRRDPADTAAARQTWCAAHGIDDPADSAPALAAEVVTPAMADPAPEVVAPGAPPVAGWPGCADSPPPPLAPVQNLRPA